MSQRRLAKVYYGDIWGLRKEDKYPYLETHDVTTTSWQELEPVAPYYFFVPKDFALQAEYEKFCRVSDIFREFRTGVATHRDHFVVGFGKTEIMQRLVVFTGNIPDDLLKENLQLKDTKDWKLREARQKARSQKLKDKILLYSYRAFDTRYICYSSILLEFDRYDLMKHILKGNNIALVTSKILSSLPFNHAFVTGFVGDNSFISNRTKEKNYFFPLYLWQDEPVGAIHELPLQKDMLKEGRSPRQTNFKPEFLQAIEESLGFKPSPEQTFCYIYAVLYSPTYRQRYEEFLKIDFPRIPLPSDIEIFKYLSALGHELVDLHLLKHPKLSETDIGFPKGGSNKVEKVSYDERNKNVRINKEQYFDGISKEVWEYHIGAYQVMEKYLKDRKGRKLSLEEINHYMKVAKALRLTIDLQERIDGVIKRPL